MCCYSDSHWPPFPDDLQTWGPVGLPRPHICGFDFSDRPFTEQIMNDSSDSKSPSPSVRYDWIHRLPRGVGHTSVASGATPYARRTVVVPTERQASSIRGDRRTDAALAVPLSCARDRTTMGSRRPVIFDVEAVKAIVTDFQGEVRRLEKRDATLRRALEIQDDEIQDLKRQLRESEKMRDTQRETILDYRRKERDQRAASDYKYAGHLNGESLFRRVVDSSDDVAAEAERNAAAMAASAFQKCVSKYDCQVGTAFRPLPFASFRYTGPH